MDSLASVHIQSVKDKIQEAEDEAIKIYGEGNFTIELLTPQGYTTTLNDFTQEVEATASYSQMKTQREIKESAGRIKMLK